ncbi:MAG: hypothetical protein H0U86_04355 [Chloroflexi bacterium]|nr:hypothetical protein [Chloroflexota bacterium]
MRSKAFGAIVLAGILSLAVFSTVSAAHWDRTELVAGNPSCDGGFKYENPLGGDIVDGTLTVPGGSIAIDVTQTSAGPVFSFVATGFVVSQVTVKGGPNALLYFYEPPVVSDSGLHSPVNVKNGKWYGLSHLCFYGDDKKAPPKK